MIALLLLPLVLPFVLPSLARRVVHQVRPGIALWAVTSAAAALAIGVVACLGVLLIPLALTVPPVAALAELIQPLRVGPGFFVTAVSALAAGALVVTSVTAVRRAWSEVRRFRAAHGDVAGLPQAGGLCVLDDPRPDAYALPGTRRRAGRIVVTTGMLRALAPAEREPLLAHERAHLAGRHHLFLAAAQLAGWCHPALAAVVPQVSFAAERVADEAAARVAGDRTLTAQAVGRAALAVTRSRERSERPMLARGVVGGPVPARVKALLAQAPTRRLAPVLVAVTLLCGTAAASSLTGALWLHDGVEVAQGEDPDHCIPSLP
ncbi:M56 family metallopeptidase [Streptomyces sp. NPDC088354]|uniref:M56 family metallopeptidase n=1 Tax=unclassified Streptomyces TaxID=2593676 RepID=UPI0029A48D7F|nr:M56 family metallopeptidase [Streptomyces sp. MI02-7b]MDX3077610.1 M56 family metallopeptidase [Streptomyces sp. MI02-7b]